MTNPTFNVLPSEPLDAYRRLYEETDLPLNVERLEHALFLKKRLSVCVVRVDQVHPQISGNKWFKLKYNLKAAIEQGASCIISFGGAYSNHLHALAYACHCLGLHSVGVVRGEPVDNPMLIDAKAWGMRLHFVNRETYRLRAEPAWLNALPSLVGDGFILPEGGSSALAVKGVGELMQQINNVEPALDYVVCACGTGGTLAGLVSTAAKTVVQGIPVLKGAGFLHDDVSTLLLASGHERAASKWELDLFGHYGGYGKMNAEHIAVMKQLEDDFSLSLDPVYTAKLFRRFMEKVENDDYPEGSRIALVHTGGLQGRRSIT
ncbi:1-aminocyclopropane-1-carboxylate deaminase/D-cysteine desulfhydrase [Neptunomonas phycophila]|uniref:1-aminocyclopropane-1-carboxylate deaminase/D-cysteine desulfhydrase n=1 Tax=Neptunomonas phycophila TaxID=1572645 RepID=UPI001BE7C190|nr:pyridoxal-phosphate dependent enzyme [Neptunomonas phycophila]MBT3147191.1 pyridoxal-phosphate dependent enzyme [Neptunomonas phycophila]